MAGKRRSREEVLKAKITKLDNELTKYNEKIDSLAEEKNKFEQELADLHDKQKKAERAAQLTALADFMDSNGYTVEDLEKLMSMPKPTEQESAPEATEEE